MMPPYGRHLYGMEEGACTDFYNGLVGGLVA